MCCFYAKCVISVWIYTFCIRYCAAFTQRVQLVFESVSFTQSMQLLGHLQILLKLLCYFYEKFGMCGKI